MILAFSSVMKIKWAIPERWLVAAGMSILSLLYRFPGRKETAAPKRADNKAVRQVRPIKVFLVRILHTLLHLKLLDVKKLLPSPFPSSSVSFSQSTELCLKMLCNSLLCLYLSTRLECKIVKGSFFVLLPEASQGPLEHRPGLSSYSINI